MMRFASAVPCLALLALVPLPLAAQEDEGADPTVHYISVTTFRAPPGEQRSQAMQWIREVMVPGARMNPNVLSYRVATHNWGSNAKDITIIAEYPSWEAIEADCEPCNEWFEEQQPEEGTPEREEWDARFDAFIGYYLDHSDELYAVNMDDYAKN